MDPNTRLFFLGAGGPNIPSEEWVLSAGGTYYLHDSAINSTTGDIIVAGHNYPGTWYPWILKISSTGEVLSNQVSSSAGRYAVHAIAQDSNNYYLFDSQGFHSRSKSTHAVGYDVSFSAMGTSYGAVFEPSYGVVYVSSYNYLTAINASNPTTLWNRSNPPEYYYYTPVIYGTTLYVGIAGYVNSQYYTCFASINKDTGGIGTLYRGFNGYFGRFMATDSSNLYLGGFPGSSGGTHGFLVKTTTAGSIAWAKQINDIGDCQGIAVDSNQNVYFAGGYGTLVKFDVNGTFLWARNGFGTFRAGTGGVRVQGDFVYAYGTTGIVKLKTTKTLPTGTYGNMVIGAPALTISNVSSSFNTVSVSNAAATTNTFTTRSADSYSSGTTFTRSPLP